MKLIIVLFFAVSCSQISTDKKDSKPIKPKRGVAFDSKKVVLDNGLTVIAVENHKLPIFSFYTFYKVGGKYEEEGITGATHYLEHMMFKGAKKYGPGEFDQLIEGNGGSNNAYTTNDLTVYHEDLPSAHVQKVIDIEADRMQNLALEPVSFEKERMVILEERKMRYENSDRGKLYLNLMSHIFEGTPYGSSVIGSIKDIKSVTREQMLNYFKSFYAPNNAVIVVAGDIDKDDVIAEINKKFGQIPANEELEKLKKNIAQKLGDYSFKGKFNKEVRLKGTSPHPMFMLGYKGVKIGVREAYILDILSSILGDGESSYLSRSFIFSRSPRLQNVYAANYTLEDSGVFFIGGTLLKGKGLKDTKNQLYKRIAMGCDLGITERSVQKIKNQYLFNMLSELKTNSGVAKFLGNREVYYGDYEFYQKELDIYNSITVEELKASCKKFLNRKDSIFISIWSKHK